MGNTWTMVLTHVIAVVLEAAAGISVALRVRNSAASLTGIANAMALREMPRFRQAIAALAAGDLIHAAHFETTTITIDNSDQIGAMAGTFGLMQEEVGASVAAFEQARESLRALISRVALTSESLTAASSLSSAAAVRSTIAVGDIAHAIELVASGAQDQAGQIADTAIAIEELSRTAEQNRRRCDASSPIH